MRTTILAYVIAVMGLVMIGVGVWGLSILEAEETIPLGDDLIAIGTIAAGFVMVGLAQALRLLLRLAAGAKPQGLGPEFH
jgi:hypothetical protein